MIASGSRSPTRRAQLGAPVVPINPTAAYLRHRAAAEKAFTARRRAFWWQRAAVVLVLCLFYFSIGRELVALARAKRDATVMGVRCETKKLMKDVQRLTAVGGLASDGGMSALDVRSAVTVAEEEGQSDLESILSQHPVETVSRPQ